MAAGSLIAAMAGNQDLNKISGFRKAMPFTYICFIIGGLALAGMPPFAGFFSKDEILAVVAARGDWHVILVAIAYLASLMTAIYTFRLIFRAFWGDASPEARELEHGHLFHAEEHRNPVNGELEDTDVGFPGPEHHIAEREGTMKIAMGVLAVGAIFAGLLQIPTVTHILHDFLHPAFEESRFYDELEPTTGATFIGMAIGAALAIAGIAIAYLLWAKDTGRRLDFHERFAAAHRVLVNKWYFDELIDALIVRPFAFFGRFARNTFERLVINGLFVGGTSGAVRAGSAAVRGVQSGYLRYYAALLVLGVTGLVFYFLVTS
jgi:NADH-quinone oxidoreductase subunit L